MDPSLGLGLRNALHAMGTGLELEPGVGSLARHPADDLLEAAVFALVAAQDLQLPAVVLDKALVHSEQVSGEQRGFIAAGSRANLQKQVGAVIRVGGNEPEHQCLFQCLPLLQQVGELRLAQGTRFRIIAGAQLLRRADVIKQTPIVRVRADQGLQPGVLLGEAAKRRLIGDDFRLAEQLADLRVAPCQRRNPGFEGRDLFGYSAHDRRPGGTARAGWSLNCRGITMRVQVWTWPWPWAGR